MAQNIAVSSRVQGSIVGVCVCDALGGPVQFRTRDTFPAVTGYRYIADFDQPPGAWSDDGSLTLCLARSLTDTRGAFSAADFATKLAAWHTSGYLSSSDAAWDEGSATGVAARTWADALAGSDAGALDVAQVQDRVDAALNAERCSGNGSLMRAAAPGLLLHRQPRVAVLVARRQSDVSHPYAVCGDACALYTALICRCMAGGDKDALAAVVAEADVSNRVLRERLAPYKTLADWQAKPREEIRSTGWVVDTLEAALWAFFTTHSFEEGALQAVNLGLDADTVGATYGGLAGAFYGLDAVPIEWRDGLVKLDLVHGIARELAEVRLA